MITVLFACTHNAGRSQIAAALFNRAARGKAQALSAGTQPAAEIHPVVREAMREIGVELTARPQRLTDDLAKEADLLVTMGCGESCPVVPGVARADWPVDDPKGRPIESVRVIVEEIGRRVDALVAELQLD